MLTVALLLPAILQVPGRSADPAVAVDALAQPLQGVLVDTPGDGNVCVLAPGYKARFGADGVEFIPFFGSRAQRNHPLTFRVQGCARGDRPWRARAT